MKIINFKNSKEIHTLDEWKSEFYLGAKKVHWRDKYSAAETAKAWLFFPPKEFDSLFGRSVEIEVVYPEYNTSFDNYGGNVRNHDLMIITNDNHGEKIVICIESKVSERFGNNTVGEYYSIKQNEKDAGKNSNVPQRIKLLKEALFSNNDDKEIDNLRYQLLTAVAGTIAEAKKHEVNKAYFIVQTFLTDTMDSENHRANERDLDLFVEKISKGTHKIIHDGDLLHIGKVPGNKFIPNDVDLYIGKYSIKI